VALQVGAWKQKWVERRWIGYFVAGTTAQGRRLRAFIRLEHFLKSGEMGANLAEKIIALCADLGFDPTALVADTAANVLSAAGTVQKRFPQQAIEVIIVPCSCHIVSLLCKTFLKAVGGPEKKGSVGQLRAIHHFFFDGPAFTTFLEAVGSPRVPPRGIGHHEVRGSVVIIRGCRWRPPGASWHDGGMPGGDGTRTVGGSSRRWASTSLPLSAGRRRCETSSITALLGSLGIHKLHEPMTANCA
jgi:hypothetical protein